MSELDHLLHSPLRRAGEERVEPELLHERFGDPGSRLITIDAASHHRIDPTAGDFDQAVHTYLGWSGPEDAPAGDPGAHHWFAARGEADGQTLRDLEAEPLLRDVLTTGAAILAWHDAEPNCEKCGGVSAASRGGFVRSCLECGSWMFPRHDPAIIIAVLDPDDRLLLAHQASWPAGRVSVVAGFVEAGESIEQSAAREVGEEVGLRLEAVRYVTSQPWPFPRSLMLSFVGAASGAPVPDGVEIEWARWYSRDDFLLATSSGEISHPPGQSVAGRMIRAWLAAELPSPRG